MKWVFGFNLFKGQRIFGIQKGEKIYYADNMHVADTSAHVILIQHAFGGIESCPPETKFLVKE